MTDTEFFASLSARAEEELKRWDMASLAIGVVKDGETVFARGFGRRDIARDLPADADTLYQIGSCSKAFTAALVAILADRGQLDLDVPIRRYVPEVRLCDELANKECTLRDLLCHRTGLPRHEYSWYGTDFTREELVEHMRYFEPSQPFRTVMQYCNYGFVLAGYIVEKITGKTWEQNLQELIFDPLGMTRTSCYVCDIENDPNHAVPYDRTPNEITGRVEIPFYRTAVENKELGIGAPFGPAGSINSTVQDMLKWVSLFLNKGRAGEKQVISESMAAEMIKPQMLRSNPLDLPNPETEFLCYGLGWFTELFRGHKYVHHGGNINGFSAFTSFLPEQNLGIVAYTNMNSTFLHYALARVIADHYLGAGEGDWPDRYYELTKSSNDGLPELLEHFTGKHQEGTAPSRPLAGYAGTFRRPGYSDMVIREEDGGLVMDYLGVKTPLKHFHYDTFVTGGIVGELPPGFPVHFRAAEVGGRIDTVKMPLVTEPGGALVAFARTEE